MKMKIGTNTLVPNENAQNEIGCGRKRDSVSDLNVRWFSSENNIWTVVLVLDTTFKHYVISGGICAINISNIVKSEKYKVVVYTVCVPWSSNQMDSVQFCGFGVVVSKKVWQFDCKSKDFTLLFGIQGEYLVYMGEYPIRNWSISVIRVAITEPSLFTSISIVLVIHIAQSLHPDMTPFVECQRA